MNLEARMFRQCNMFMISCCTSRSSLVVTVLFGQSLNSSLDQWTLSRFGCSNMASPKYAMTHTNHRTVGYAVSRMY